MNLFIPNLTSPNPPQPKTMPTLYIPTDDGMPRISLGDSVLLEVKQLLVTAEGGMKDSPLDRNRVSVSLIIIQSSTSAPMRRRNHNEDHR